MTLPVAAFAAVETPGRVARPALMERALEALATHRSAIWSADVVAVADFAAPSRDPRLHLVDLLRGTTLTMRVAHGWGSDPDHRGLLARFSDEPGSRATAEGAYLTGDPYVGAHGASRRLVGLDPSNANAEARAIVIHSAWYANDDVVARQGMMGRSDGCFVVSETDIVPLLARLGRGRLLYAAA